jgi:peptidoglycan-N-acetylglucosamine deacetylase
MIIPKPVSRFLHFLFPSLIFRISNKDSALFLTFDDGPCPGVTEFVLKCLEEYKAKATFFCLGESVYHYPALYQQILSAGHQTGNHSWGHPNVLRIKNSDFLKEIERADEIIGTRIFRPPYGRLLPWQIIQLRKKYEIILWEILIPDYKDDLDCDRVLARLTRKITAGAIIVMHDSLKSSNNLHYILPRLLKEFTERGYTFESMRSGQG